jgi:uncharacterized protein YtpQ (UPF0354 family)
MMLRTLLATTVIWAASLVMAEVPRPQTRLDTLHLMQDALTAADPNLNISLNAEELLLTIPLANGSPLQLSPDNLHISLQSAPSAKDREATINAYVTGYMEVIAQAGDTGAGAPAFDMVRPVLRGREYAELVAEGSVPFMAFPGDLIVYWVIDSPNSTESFSAEHLAVSGLTQDALAELALENLRIYGAALEHMDMDGAWMLRLDGYYESSMMLVPEVWQAIDAKLGTLVAAPIARDLVIYTDADDPVMLTNLRATAREAFAELPYAISPDVFRWNGTGWDVMP